MEELIKLQEIYIQMLIAELEEVVPIAHNHGWRSKRFEEGELMRQKMKEAKEAIPDRDKENAIKFDLMKRAVLTVPDRVTENSTTTETRNG